MKSLSFVLGIAACSIIGAAPAVGQTCLGRPYFSTGPMQFGVSGSVGNHTSSVGGDFSAGRDHFLFGQARLAYEAGQTRVGVSEPSGAAYGATVGYQVGVSPHVQMCPYAAGDMGNLGYKGGADVKRSNVQLGATFGWALPSSSSVHLVPFAGAAFAQMGRTVTEVNGTKRDLAVDTYTPIVAGLGVHFQNSMMLIGQLNVPVDLGGADPSLGVRMVIPFGKQ